MNMEHLQVIAEESPRAALALAQELLNGFEIAAADGDANTMAESLHQYPIENPRNLSLAYMWLSEK